MSTSRVTLCLLHFHAQPALAVIALTLIFSGKLIANELGSIHSENVKLFLARVAFRFLAALFLVLLLAPLLAKLAQIITPKSSKTRL